ncbi:MAG: hypothetical protein HY238_16815, partial [Acidobacteria bacterium]|nr:hypothetical protein [Acidobacteriota bacterium]
MLLFSRKDAKNAKVPGSLAPSLGPTIHDPRSTFRLPLRLGLSLALAAICWAGADGQRYVRDVRELARPEMKGRADGSPELEKAAQYLVRGFQAAGLQPLHGKSYLQPFTVSTGATLGKGNLFEVRNGVETQVLRPGED